MYKDGNANIRQRQRQKQKLCAFGRQINSIFVKETPLDQKNKKYIYT